MMGWQWHQLNHMQSFARRSRHNHASTSPLSFLQAGCPSCHPSNSVKVTEGKVLLNCVESAVEPQLTNQPTISIFIFLFQC